MQEMLTGYDAQDVSGIFCAVIYLHLHLLPLISGTQKAGRGMEPQGFVFIYLKFMYSHAPLGDQLGRSTI